MTALLGHTGGEFYGYIYGTDDVRALICWLFWLIFYDEIYHTVWAAFQQIPWREISAYILVG